MLGKFKRISGSHNLGPLGPIMAMAAAGLILLLIAVPLRSP